MCLGDGSVHTDLGTGGAVKEYLDRERGAEREATRVRERDNLEIVADGLRDQRIELRANLEDGPEISCVALPAGIIFVPERGAVDEDVHQALFEQVLLELLRIDLDGARRGVEREDERPRGRAPTKAPPRERVHFMDDILQQLRRAKAHA
jgi:hypothetical protein